MEPLPELGDMKIGLGTGALKSSAETESVFADAIECGYRLFDTAGNYPSRISLGKAMKRSSVPRSQLYVIGKVSADYGPESVSSQLNRLLQDLQTSYVDLYLLHWPLEQEIIVRGRRTFGGQRDFHEQRIKRLEAYRRLLQLQEAGLCRAIGVSNFTVKQLIDLIQECDHVPAACEVQHNLFWSQTALIRYCQGKGIQIVGYSPLAPYCYPIASPLQNDEVVRIAKQLCVEPAQVLLAWGMRHSVIPIPRSSSSMRIRSNLKSISLKLSDKNFEQLNGFGLRCCNNAQLCYRVFKPSSWFGQLQWTISNLIVFLSVDFWLEFSALFLDGKAYRLCYSNKTVWKWLHVLFEIKWRHWDNFSLWAGYRFCASWSCVSDLIVQGLVKDLREQGHASISLDALVGDQGLTEKFWKELEEHVSSKDLTISHKTNEKPCVYDSYEDRAGFHYNTHNELVMSSLQIAMISWVGCCFNSWSWGLLFPLFMWAPRMSWLVLCAFTTSAAAFLIAILASTAFSQRSLSTHNTDANISSLLGTLTHHRVLSVVNIHLGMFSRLNNYFIRSTRVSGASRPEGIYHSNQKWHIDVEDFASVKVFISLSPIEVESGPVYMVPSTHAYGANRLKALRLLASQSSLSDEQVAKKFPRSSWVDNCGGSGMVTFVDTSALHKGGYTIQGERNIVIACYNSFVATGKLGRFGRYKNIHSVASPRAARVATQNADVEGDWWTRFRRATAPTYSRMCI